MNTKFKKTALDDNADIYCLLAGTFSAATMTSVMVALLWR